MRIYQLKIKWDQFTVHKRETKERTRDAKRETHHEHYIMKWQAAATKNHMAGSAPPTLSEINLK